MRAVAEIHEADPEVTIVAKANCGIPQIIDGTLWYPTASEGMTDYAKLALDAGARIVGACCGSVPEHIVQIRAVVDSYTPASHLDDSLVETLLGGDNREVSDEGRSRRRSRRRDSGARR